MEMNNYHNSNRTGPIPPRWLKCPRKSGALIGNKFLAFKTPLSEKFNDQVPAESQFTPKMFLEAMHSYKVKIGLWIDLTNTRRFYDTDVIRKSGAKYLKINCQGRGQCPSKDQVSDFVRECTFFIRKYPLEVVAVHCTHGFNRTGFMIASYFIIQQEWSCDMAIAQFAKARTPGIYKQDYIDELYLRYDDADASPPAPSLPEWCFGDPDEDDDDGDNSTNSSQGTMVRNGKVKNATFMEGVPGVELVTDARVLYAIQKRIQELCDWKKNGFPGCQPVSMTLENMLLLSVKPYKISWKADGTRYMMYIDNKESAYFADRDFSLFKIHGLTFPDKRNLHNSICNTLLDGEMVIDINPTNGERIPRYLIYDAVRIHGKDITHDNFHLRFERINTDIIRPRNAAIEQGLIIRKDEPFSLRRKDFWDANLLTTSKLLSPAFRNQLLHEPDGLILQPEPNPYIAGVSGEVLKWKPASHNSVDFKVKIVTQRQEGMPKITKAELYVGNLSIPFASMKASKTVKEQDGKIIECKFDNNEWVFMRVRTDKSFPNSYNTVTAVCQSISNPVTEQKLLDYLHNEGYRRSDRDLMPPPKKMMKVK